MNRPLSPEEMDKNLESIEKSVLNIEDTLSLKEDKKNNFDFLFVDAWSGLEGEYIPESPSNGMKLVDTNNGVSYHEWSDTYITWIPIAGYGMPIPISSTTIFIHPATSERYIFNGTAMEVYNDADNIVPRWRTYKALLTQSGEDAPVARVLNRDDHDYLGDIEWSRMWTGAYFGLNKNYNSFAFISCISQMINPISNAGYAYIIESHLNTNGIEVIASGFDTTVADITTSSDNKLFNSPVEIKVRQRGAPPKLLSAETDTTGDRVILTFDKKMSNYNSSTTQILDYIMCYDAGPNEGDVYFSSCVANDNKLELTVSDDYIINSTSILSFGDGGYLTKHESFDYGLIQSFSNFPVKNNVPAPPQLLDAYTNEDGTQVTLVFDKAMEQPSNQVNFDWHVSFSGDSYASGAIAVGNNIILTGIYLPISQQCVISYSPITYSLKSLDGGIVSPFSGYEIDTTNLIL